MEIPLTPTNQTIHLSGAGRSGVLAQLLTADQQRAAAIGDWVDQLVASATTLDIPLNTHDVRTFLPELIESLEDVIKKSHPDELRGYGSALEPVIAQVLARWCADARVYTKALTDAWLGAAPTPTVSATDDYAFPTTLPLAKYQRMALEAFLHVGNDALVVLKSVLRLARRPYAPLFCSSLREDDLSCCDAAYHGLTALFAVGQQWVARQSEDPRCFMVADHLRHADIALSLLFEGMHDSVRRHLLAGLLIQLSILKRQM